MEKDSDQIFDTHIQLLIKKTPISKLEYNKIQEINIEISSQGKCLETLLEKSNISNIRIDELENNLKLQNKYLESILEKNIIVNSEINEIIQKLSKPTFFQQIFSVKNEGNHKVLRILGIKVKLKRN